MVDTNKAPSNSSTDEVNNTFVGLIIGPVFIVIAAWFVFGPDPAVIPALAQVSVSKEEVSTAPLRKIITGIPTINSGGFDLRCMECHKLFPSSPKTSYPLTQHLHIDLNHGINDQCLNCHDDENRNKLVLRGGETVPFSEAQKLCANCHGPTFRDWEMGMHGRTNGYWDKSRGTQIRLICTECHDPHAPAMAPMIPLPGPNTLRMGNPDEAEHQDSKKHNPLRQWSKGKSQDARGEELEERDGH